MTTTILDAVTSPTIADAAHAFIGAGCSIIPLVGKKPARANFYWQHWMNNQPTHELIAGWLKRGMMQNIGLIAGHVSGGLVLLDVDSLDACAEFEAAFPSAAGTLTIRSGSGRGRHYYFYSAETPTNVYRGGIELRAQGAYVVAPPSIHPESGQPYTVLNAAEPRRYANMNRLAEWISARGQKDEQPRRQPSPRPAAFRGDAYGRAVLKSECQDVAFAKEGERNRTLYIAALRLGTLIGAGMIDRISVEIGLETAAAGLTADEGINATRKTIRSGIETGMKNANTRRGA